MNQLPGVLFISSYPPRECGIATFSQDLIKMLNLKFSQSFSFYVCGLEADKDKHVYSGEVKYILRSSFSEEYTKLAKEINEDPEINLVVVEHEFGLFFGHEDDLRRFLFTLDKPVLMSFHTVLPNPKPSLRQNVQSLASACESLIVMTGNSAAILTNEYDIPRQKIEVIPHGTHLIPHKDKNALKKKYGVTGKKVLSTFGLLSAWKGIEVTLEALPDIVRENPDVLFLAIGKTHPEVVKREGEEYRNQLKARIKTLNLQEHVRFINRYLSLTELLEYLQLTDVYLFTSKDPNQAVSGTFTYAMSCACPIVSTRIPHAVEVLKEGSGILIDFNDSNQLTVAVHKLLQDENLRIKTGLEALYEIAPTAWENAAIAHARLFQKAMNENATLKYNLPEINLQHIKNMTTDFGIIQFAKINQPDTSSGYALDDNAMAMIALTQHFERTKEEAALSYIGAYLNYIEYCLQPGGSFLNYVGYDRNFTEENNTVSLEDANGRAVWALGYLVSRGNLLPASLVDRAESMLVNILPGVKEWKSPRSIAFSIKGLHYYNNKRKLPTVISDVETLADKLVQKYRKEAERNWEWFESYLTYANSVLPEAMLRAYLETGKTVYKDIAKESFSFLLNKMFDGDSIRVISNKSWLYKGEETFPYGEQPIDVAYTVLALGQFYKVFKDPEYLQKMDTAFSWFLGNNHLSQIIYNPCTGGCYDGLEESYVNLNQGAESTVSYLMARLYIEQFSGEQAIETNINADVPIHDSFSYQVKPLE